MDANFISVKSGGKKVVGLGLTKEHENINLDIGKKLHYVFGLTFLLLDEYVLGINC